MNFPNLLIWLFSHGKRAPFVLVVVKPRPLVARSLAIQRFRLCFEIDARVLLAARAVGSLTGQKAQPRLLLVNSGLVLDTCVAVLEVLGLRGFSAHYILLI